MGEEESSQWNEDAWSCLGVLWDAISDEHQDTMPTMGCKRSGRCCSKQVPRVSVFELAHATEAIPHMPKKNQDKLRWKCRKAASQTYTNPITGEGVSCPMLEKDTHGVHSCGIHQHRPFICKLSSVSTPLSWDCPLWGVYKDRFPVLPKEFVKPIIDLFSYCRNTYARNVLKRNDRKQMLLLSVGLLALLGEYPPSNRNPLVTAGLSHKEECSDELYFRTMDPPPHKGVDNTTSHVVT